MLLIQEGACSSARGLAAKLNEAIVAAQLNEEEVWRVEEAVASPRVPLRPGLCACMYAIASGRNCAGVMATATMMAVTLTVWCRSWRVAWRQPELADSTALTLRAPPH
jgi:hypothetical protein